MVETIIEIQIFGTREKQYPTLKKINAFLEQMKKEARAGDVTVSFTPHKRTYFDRDYFQK